MFSPRFNRPQLRSSPIQRLGLSSKHGSSTPSLLSPKARNSPFRSPALVKESISSSSSDAIHRDVLQILRSSSVPMTAAMIISSCIKFGFNHSESDIQNALATVSSKVLHEKPVLRVPGFAGNHDNPLLTTMYLYYPYDTETEDMEPETCSQGLRTGCSLM
ncbi:hypothetical protein GEMRC1_010864 [Eukaryota sp. GEM-RC1]